MIATSRQPSALIKAPSMLGVKYEVRTRVEKGFVWYCGVL